MMDQSPLGTAIQHEIAALLSNLISGYYRDLYLTKESVMKALSTTQDSLKIAILLFRNLSVNAARCMVAMTEDLFATEKAYQLVQQGLPFREAHRQVANNIAEQ